MSKKSIKLILAILIILIILLAVNYARNYEISNKIKKAGNSFLNSSNYQIIIKEAFNTETYVYFKDNKCVINTYLSGEFHDYFMKDYSTGENSSSYDELDNVQVDYDSMILSLKNKIALEFYNPSLLTIISERDGCYVIKDTNSEYDILYEKNTGLLKRLEKRENGKVMSQNDFILEINTVTDEHMNEYKEQL